MVKEKKASVGLKSHVSTYSMGVLVHSLLRIYPRDMYTFTEDDLVYFFVHNYYNYIDALMISIDVFMEGNAIWLSPAILPLSGQRMDPQG